MVGLYEAFSLIRDAFRKDDDDEDVEETPYVCNETTQVDDSFDTGKNVCRALALSGGGSNGAWEAGVIWGFMNYGSPDDFTYDVVTGVSAGSINGLAVSGWEIGDEVAMADWLSDMWNSLTTDDVWVNWDKGVADGVLLKPGAVNNAPLLNFLQ